MVLVEAAIFGRPLISTELGTGTSFVNVNEETGLVVPPADPVRLAGALKRLASDDAFAQKCGANARQRYEALFSAEALGRSYAQLYQSVSARDGSV